MNLSNSRRPLVEGELTYNDIPYDIINVNFQDEFPTMPEYSLFNQRNPNLLRLVSKKFHIERTYEEPDSTYLIVLTPRNRWKKDNYRKDIPRLEKMLRSKLKYKRIIITREINATKVHYNILITTSKDILKMHNKTFGKYYNFYVQKTPQVNDIKNAMQYICKEGDKRAMTSNDVFQYSK